LNISVNNVLEKMAKELNQAKSTSDATKVRDSLIAIRTLCDVVLEEAPEEKSVRQPINQFSSHLLNNEPKPLTINTSTKLQEDDGNGDSLLDF
jgi:hypothetical protein